MFDERSGPASIADFLAARRPGHTLPAALYIGQDAFTADCLGASQSGVPQEIHEAA